MNILKNTKLQVLIIVLLTGLVYSNIFQNQFATDDIGYFYNWQIPKHFENISKIFTTDSVPQDERGVYRPVKALAIMLVYKIFGLNVFGYHLVGLITHLLSTILVFFITKQILLKSMNNDQSSYLRNEKRKMNNAIPIFHLSSFIFPFITALLFGVHPIHTEAITFILASFDSIGFLFYLLAFYLYIKARKILWSLVFAGLAFFTYELTLSLPLVLLLYEFLLGGKRQEAGSTVKLAFVRVSPYFILLGFYIVFRFFILKIPPRQEYLMGSFYISQLTMTFAWVKYLFLMIFPFDLNLNHQILPGVYSVISKEFIDKDTLKSLSLFKPQVLLNITIITFIVVKTFIIRKKLPLISFSILWFFVTLLPVGFFLPQSTILAERYAYLASFGFILLLVHSSWFIVQRFKKHALILLVTCLLLLVSFYSYQTFNRNKDWKDTETVWVKMSQQNKDDPNTFLTLGKFYFEKKDYEKATLNFEKAKILLEKSGIQLELRQ